MIYRIINFSDTVTVEAPDDTHGAVAALTLGEGTYGCQHQQGHTVLPPILVASEEDLHQLFDHIGLPRGPKTPTDRLSHWVGEHLELLARVLESALYMPIDERVLHVQLNGSFHTLSPVMRKTLIAATDDRRSSTNEIVKYSRSCAAALRKRLHREAQVDAAKPAEVP